jgi:hypothetical protein
MSGGVVRRQRRCATKFRQRFLMIEIVGEVEALFAKGGRTFLRVRLDGNCDEQQEDTQTSRRSARWPACGHGLMIATGDAAGCSAAPNVVTRMQG